MCSVTTTERSLPQCSPSPRDLDDVELPRMGALAPSAVLGVLTVP